MSDTPAHDALRAALEAFDRNDLARPQEIGLDADSFTRLMDEDRALADARGLAIYTPYGRPETATFEGVRIVTVTGRLDFEAAQPDGAAAGAGTAGESDSRV